MPAQIRAKAEPPFKQFPWVPSTPRKRELDWDASLLFQLLGSGGMSQFGNEPVAARMEDDTLSVTAFSEAVESFSRNLSSLHAHV